jgi:hypothetical protein
MKATRFYKPDAGDDRMKENDEDVGHAGIVSKSPKNPEIRADFGIRHRQELSRAMGKCSACDLTELKSPDCQAASLLFHWFPGFVGVEPGHLPSRSRCVRTQILFINDTPVIHDEGLDPRDTVFRRPGNQGKSADHLAFYHVA